MSSGNDVSLRFGREPRSAAAAGAPWTSSRRGEAVIGAVSGLLGMSPRGLREELESGKTMADLAEERGISQTDLLRAVNEATLLARTSHRPVDDEATKRSSGYLASRVGGLDVRI